MSTLTEIERAVQALGEGELATFRQWFAEYDADAWDRQIDADAASGRLDALAAEALADHNAVRCTDL